MEVGCACIVGAACLIDWINGMCGEGQGSWVLAFAGGQQVFGPCFGALASACRLFVGLSDMVHVVQHHMLFYVRSCLVYSLCFRVVPKLCCWKVCASNRRACVMMHDQDVCSSVVTVCVMTAVWFDSFAGQLLGGCWGISIRHSWMHVGQGCTVALLRCLSFPFVCLAWCVRMWGLLELVLAVSTLQQQRHGCGHVCLMLGFVPQLYCIRCIVSPGCRSCQAVIQSTVAG